MILKKLKRTNFEKPKASMIAALVDYIFAEKDEYGNDKLMYSGALNFITGTLAAQKNEMIALAEESVQSKMPIAHWVMSWQENAWVYRNIRRFTPCTGTPAIIMCISPSTGQTPTP